MNIKIKRSGGICGIQQEASGDVAGDKVEAAVETARSVSGADRFQYVITVGDRKVTTGETPAVQAVWQLLTGLGYGVRA
jgi:hypothetical protein